MPQATDEDIKRMDFNCSEYFISCMLFPSHITFPCHSCLSCGANRLEYIEIVILETEFTSENNRACKIEGWGYN
jgi:hypothetical protein